MQEGGGVLCGRISNRFFRMPKRRGVVPNFIVKGSKVLVIYEDERESVLRYGGFKANV